jgi:hypothetical protein
VVFLILFNDPFLHGNFLRSLSRGNPLWRCWHRGWQGEWAVGGVGATQADAPYGWLAIPKEQIALHSLFLFPQAILRLG